MGIITYDFFNLPEIPTFILCNPNKEELFALGAIIERKYSAKFNALSELSFKAYEYVDDILMPYYDHLRHKRLVYVENIGYFMITDVSEKGDGVEKYKEIKCQSLEVEFASRNLAKFERTSVLLYNAVDPEGTILGDIIDYMPDWTIGDVSGELLSKYRSFNISDKSIYNFLMNEVEETYECVFEFDTITKTVHAKTLEEATQTTDIYISYDNLLENIQIEETSDELVTALTILGGNDLDIRGVNPLGTNTIYDFSYFTNIEWMSQDLIDAVQAWEDLVSGSKVVYGDLYSEARTIFLEEYVPVLTEWSGSMTNLAALEQQQAVLIEQGYGQDPNNPEEQWTTILTSIQETSASIALADSEKEALNTEMEVLWDEMGEISGSLALSNTDNFTITQQKKLQPFIIESTYINENIIQTDNMNTAEIQDEAEELYRIGKDTLARISEPRFTFSVDSANFMLIKDFEPFMEEATLGAILNLELSPGAIIYPILLGMELDFDNPESFSLKFGNRLRLDDEAFQFSDLMNEAISAAGESKVNSLLWGNWTDNYKDRVSLFIDSALDASLNTIISGSAQEIIITPAGLRGRKYVSETTYSDEQVWLVNNTLAFTDDNWDSVKIAIGRFTVSEGGTAWGIVADYLIGRIIAGNNLMITNYDEDTGESSFIVSGSQTTLTNMDLKLTTDDEETIIYINPTDGIKINTDGTDVFYVDPVSGDLTFTGNLSGASGTFSGEISATTGDIGGWKITSGSLVSPTNNSGMSSGATWAFYTGGAVPASAPFRVSHSGNLYANNADIKGKIEATSGSFTGTITAATGTIGGWTINSSGLYYDANNYIYTSSAKLANGNVTISGASVTITGNIYASGGKIGLWDLNSSGLRYDASNYLYPGGFSLASGSIVWGSGVLTVHGTINAYSGKIANWNIIANEIYATGGQTRLYASGSLVMASGNVMVNADGLKIKEKSSAPTWPDPSGVNWTYDQYRTGGMYGHLNSGDQCLYIYNYSSSLSYDSKILIYSSNYNGDAAEITLDAATLHTSGDLHGGNLLFRYATSGVNGSIRFRAKYSTSNINAIESGNYANDDVQNLSITGYNGNAIPFFGINATTTYITGKLQVVTSDTDANRYTVYWNSSTNGLIFVSSDEKLKENISYNVSGLSIINKLKPATFNFIDNPEKRIGFIAQDTLKVSPYLAWNNKEEDTWGLGGWDAFSAVIVKALQEQTTIIEKLEKRLELLEKE